MRKPNVLIILADGMQADTVSPDHVCQTPRLNALAQQGVTFQRAHTTCPTCSPARASLMTGLLPHNHGVLEVEHGRDPDQCVLRSHLPHFAQRLGDSGYRTAYFGKWHIERSNDLSSYGWKEGVVKGHEHVRDIGKGSMKPAKVEIDESLAGFVEGPRGYRRILHWAVTDTPSDQRYPGVTVLDAERFLSDAIQESTPWCCCVSFSEPNEALVVSRDVWNRYDPGTVPLPTNFFDDLSDRPRLYQRQRQIGQHLSEDHWRAARVCYFGRITEIDELVQRLLSQIEQAGKLDETVVIFLADHGRYVGGHGFEAHNFGGFEEIYRIPLMIAGPDVATGASCDALVSIADLCPTLCELTDAESIDVPDSRSFADLLAQPDQIPSDFATGYAEYHGTRFPLMQRILWHGPWKLVFNGFDFDELYNLDEDPHEMHNLANDPAQQQRLEDMMTEVWSYVRKTGDRAILESHYFSMRMGCVGPDVGSE